MANPVLEVIDLHVTFPSDDGDVKAVDGLSYQVAEGETLAIVGESGSGKSVSSMAVLGILPKRARIRGEIRFRGRDLLPLREGELRTLRGSRIAMVFQDALASLNPVFKVGDQIAEAVTVHRGVGRAEVRERVLELLDIVGIPSPAQRAEQYPHELSGGMRQRAMIAMAIANEPDLLIADEPTTALDVTIQAQVLEVFERIQDRTSSAILLITHDLGVVAGMADRVLVMYAGRPVELAPVDEIFYHCRHPYSMGLMAAIPDITIERERLNQIDGAMPRLNAIPKGCAYNPRCPRVFDRCLVERPDLMEAGATRAACWLHDAKGEGERKS
jgi:oligopeptide/dipeptide ABC transporter ATP-binding protein